MNKTLKTAVVEFWGGFHNRESIKFRVEVRELNGFKLGLMSPSQAKRLDKHLCGISGCTCGAAARAESDLGDLDGLEIFRGI